VGRGGESLGLGDCDTPVIYNDGGSGLLLLVCVCVCVQREKDGDMDHPHPLNNTTPL